MPNCPKCGCRSTRHGLCQRCMELVHVCRAALTTMLRNEYIEKVGPHAYLFHQPVASEIADLLAATDAFVAR